MNIGLKMIATALSVLIVSGCSFHSAQWESAKALWALTVSDMQPEQVTYWWDMKHKGEPYRLFPVAWDDKTVLTDGRRWIIVVQQNDILMIRDLSRNQQISFEVSAGATSVRDGGVSGIGTDSFGSESQGVSIDPRSLTRLSIIEGPIGRPAEIVETSMLCYPSDFDSKVLRLVTRCFSGGQETNFRMADYDQSGNILKLQVSVPSADTWAIYRSNDVVDVLAVKCYLDGDVNEI